VWLIAAPVAAQQGSSAPSGTSDDRLFGALPDFLTVKSTDTLPPLTTKQKFSVTARSTFDVGQYLFFGGLAGISQAENADPGYRQGGVGYAKRFGLALADGTTENLLTSAIVPSMFHQDPRYYRLGTGSVLHRTGYALSRIFVTRSDSGHTQFNVSEILGSAAAAGLYNTYHPASDRTLANALATWGMQIGYDTGFIVIREFWPDARRRAAAQNAQPSATSDSYVPIRGDERINWIIGETVGPSSLAIGVIKAGFRISLRAPTRWGFSQTGFWKRLENREIDVGLSNSIEAGLGAVWGEEPRYVRSHRSGIWPRFAYASKTVLETQRTDGHLAPAWGRYAGNVLNNAIERIWLPSSRTTWQRTTLDVSSGFLTRWGGNLWREFWPDVHDRITRRHPGVSRPPA
jgi:hypothetical protein